MEYSYSQRICETYNSGLHSDNLNNIQADIIKGITLPHYHITTSKIEYQNRLSSILDTCNNTAEEYADILTTLKRKLAFAIARNASLCLRSSGILRPGAESRFTGIRRAQLNADDKS
ncbi:hypothetical protein GJ496_010005 [Pomphorhynchus laevis]|nr:hypothetical protein GJ496_010005 [Pomphorhynchus laevis]